MIERLTIPAVSKLYGVHINTVRNWLTIGAVAGVKDSSGRWLIRRDAVEKLMARRSRKTADDCAVSNAENQRLFP